MRDEKPEITACAVLAGFAGGIVTMMGGTSHAVLGVVIGVIALATGYVVVKNI